MCAYKYREDHLYSILVLAIITTNKQLQMLLHVNVKITLTFCICSCCISQPDMGQAMKIVDLAGAPSEFSHYVYWKRQHMVKVREN